MMSGTAKWLIVGSVVVIALATLIALGLFGWMVFRSPMMSGMNAGWGMVGMGEGWSGPWNGRSGMMGNYGSGDVGMMGGPGMGVPQAGSAASDKELTLEVVEARLEEFLDGRNDLIVGEIMIFDNHAYTQIIEVESGIGAMELIVDPSTLSVSPEHGPNMMWNLKYSTMHRGGMMGNVFTWEEGEVMSISPEEAVELAQAYLDRVSADLTSEEHADPFYGYYTIHTLRDGEVEGMLSVNGYSGDVFPHNWHGTLLAMSEDHHD
jgi:hypothetical protein